MHLFAKRFISLPAVFVHEPTLLSVAVSLGNYLNRRRHTNDGWVLAGFFPILNPDKGTYKGVNRMPRRKVRLWHACAKIFCNHLKEAFATGVPVKCADGKVRMVKPIVALWLGDREEHEVLCSLVSVSPTRLLATRCGDMQSKT
jgi:hypothetical protein